jgi:pimeloyl-ACP methyl ester carboxylesterase
VIAIGVEGRGAPLILLHGVGTSSVVWRRVRPLLATKRLVATPDLPGFGSSPPVGRGFELERVAEAVADALAARLRAPFDLLGNSLGGAVALVLAAQRPELVRRLVLAAPAGLSPLPGPVPALAGRTGSTLIAVRRLGAPALVRSAAGRRMLLFGTVADPSAVPAEDAGWMVSGSRGSTRIAQAIAAVARADLRPRLAELTVPAAFLWGASDRVIPVGSLRPLQALAPEAPTEVIPGTGHAPQLERPREFVGALERLLSRITVR